MALEIDYETRHGIVASYWRIEQLRIYTKKKIIRAHVGGHTSWKQAGGPHNDPDRTRPEKPSEPLHTFRITARDSLYDQHVKNLDSGDQTAEAYEMVKAVGVPDGIDAGIDFSNATDA